MKRVFVLTILFYIGHFPLMNAQSLNDGMYNNQWENERDAINQEVIEKQRWQNDYYYEYLRNQQYNSQLYQKVNTAVNQAKGGIRIETSSYPPTSSSSKHTTNQQAQQMKKAQYEANHRAWQEQRRAQQAQAAEEARIRKKREEQRKREDKQRRYVQARDMDLQISAGHYQRQHNQITYNVTEGYERTMNYQPEGSQQLQSQYIPSSDKPTYDIAAIISKSGGKAVALRESELNKANSHWDELLDKTKLENRIRDYVNASRSFTELYITHPQDLTQLLHDEFKTVAGYDVDAIMQKLPSERTNAENQALMDYQAYRKEMFNQMAKDINGIIDNSEEKKLIDAAFLANKVYDPYKGHDDYNTNYKRMVRFPKDHPLRGVTEAIHNCNQSGAETGFHAEIYYNKQNDSYIISIAGSDDTNDWTKNNIPNLLNSDDIPQYNMAIDIAKAINNIPNKDKHNIEIVGHSLGGGVASVIGLATGFETKTFNAARVPASFLQKHGMNGQNASNITAYHTSTDILTIAQQAAGTPAIGKPVNIGDSSTLSEKSKAMAKGASAGFAITSSSPGITGIGTVGGALLGEKAEGHRMGPMVRSIVKNYTNKGKVERERLRHIQMEFVNAANSPEMQTRETMLFRKTW